MSFSLIKYPTSQTINTLYSANGSLSGNRTVDGNSKTLAIQNVSSFQLSTQAAGQNIILNNQSFAVSIISDGVHLIGTTSVGQIAFTPSALLHIGPGTTSTAPLKITSGVLLSTPADGSIEYDGTHFYGTIGSTRTQLDNVSSGSFILNQTSQQASSNFNISGNGIVGGSLNATGVLSSSSTSQIAGVTNSGVTINGGNNFAYVSLFDQNQTVNNRTGELIFISGQLQLRFLNDAHSTAVVPLSMTGGQATGITGIASNSGSGVWAHTGNYTATGTISSLPSGGNSVILTGSASAGVPTLSTDGVNSNVSLQINTKGSGGITLNAATNVIGAFTQSGGNVGITQSVGGQFSITNNNAALSGPQAAFVIQGNNSAGPAIGIGNTSQGADGKWWDIMPNGATLNFRTVTDAGAPVATFLTFTRSGSAIAGIASNSGSGSWIHTGSFTATGIINTSIGLFVKEGSNAKQGVATLVAGAVTVSNTNVTANSRIFLTGQDDNGGTPGFLRVSARVAGTSFTITSSSGADTSIVAYEIFEPGS